MNALSIVRKYYLVGPFFENWNIAYMSAAPQIDGFIAADDEVTN